MNHLQLLLLKLIEECGEVATEIMEIKNYYQAGAGGEACDFQPLNGEINDYYAVTQYMNDKYGLGYGLYVNEEAENAEMQRLRTLDKATLPDYVIKLALDVQKIASKTMQFGMHEVNPKLPICNQERLLIALNAFGLGLLTFTHKFDTGFIHTTTAMDTKIQKLDKYAEYSRGLGCVDLGPVPEHFYKTPQDD